MTRCRRVAVAITPGSAAADAVGDTLQFTATVRDSTGATRTGVVVAWNSDRPDVVRSIGQGKFIAEGEGSAIVVGKVGAIADTAAATVQQVVTAVSLTAPDTNVRLGGTLMLSALLGRGPAGRWDQPGVEHAAAGCGRIRLRPAVTGAPAHLWPGVRRATLLLGDLDRGRHVGDPVRSGARRGPALAGPRLPIGRERANCGAAR
jgi:hypothetical protein